MPPRIAVDPALVESYLMALARFGAYGQTGVWRTVYSPDWLAAQDQYADWCAEVGLAVRRDAMGNVWGRLEGTGGGKAIVSGSHVDSQCPGGRYDGALGALAGLIALKILGERFGPPRRPLECVSLCQEESSRFPRANFMASRAITGRLDRAELDSMRDHQGGSLREAMTSVGLDPERFGEVERDDIDAFLELHIEQGPILEQAGRPVGIVSAITGLRHYMVTVDGRADHAGAMPMDLRRDPMAGAAEIISGVIENALRMGRPTVTTVGRIAAEPNAPPIVPERVVFSVDARHPDPARREELYAQHEALFEAVGQRRGLEVSWEATADRAPCLCDPALIRLLEEAAREQGIPTLTMASGAGHDSQVMARICPVAMIFVQSKDGRSHTPAEYSSPEHCAAGIQLLAAGLHRLAYRPAAPE